MTLDGFLTFLALAVAIYALVPRVTKLRAKLGIVIQAPVAILSLLLVLYLEFFQWIGRPCPAPLGSICHWLVFPVDDSITPPQVAFLVVLVWLGCAGGIHRFFSRPGAASLRTVSRIVDHLMDEQRFAELLDFVKPYLPLINQAACRRLRSQRLHDRLADRKSSSLGFGVGISGLNPEEIKDALEREPQRSSFYKKFRRCTGNLVVLVPSRRHAETTAKHIAGALFRSKDLTHHMARTRPDVGISLLQIELSQKRHFSDAFFRALISDTGGVLYQELEQRNTQNGTSKSNRLLYFLFADVRTARTLEVSRPVGEYLLELLRLDASVDAIAFLNKTAEGFDEDRWKDPVWAGIFFFHLMVTAAADQGVRWHMWLYYLPRFVARLEELYDTSNPAVDKSAEFPTRSARLIYETVVTLCGWVRLMPTLPDDSPHRQSVVMSEGPSREWCPWVTDNENIPGSAAMALGSCMVTIVMSEQINDKFKGYMLEVILRTIKELGRDGEEGHLRSFLIRSIVHGGQSQPDPHYRKCLADLGPMVDHVIRAEVDDYESALTAAN